MNFNMKKIAVSLVLLFAFAGHSFATASSPSITDYTSYPIFISQTVTPNVLIILDNSGSMSWAAYWGEYDPSTRYYGYFGNDEWYSYDGNKFVEDSTASLRFKGNMLNWAVMRKVDVARKVLVGGKAVSRVGRGRKTLVGDSSGAWGGWKHNWDGVTWENSQDVVAPAGRKPYWFAPGYNGEMLTWYWDLSSGTGVYNYYNIKVEVEHEDTIGLIQRTESSVRYGLGFFNYDRGAYIAQRVSNNNGSNLLTSIQNTNPSTWTPLAEAFYETVMYFKQAPTAYSSGDFSRNSQWDPYYDEDLGEFVPCAKSFVILITDGESTQDKEIPTGYMGTLDYDNDGNESGNPPAPVYLSDGSDYLDDIALWAHTTDLRSGLDGKQSITLYPVFAFGQGSQLLVDAAKNGGFTDKNGNDIPDLDSEWDSDGDGIPDNYFEAEDGFALESSLINAINDIMKRATSGTAVSVLSTSSRGEGAVYQAYFLPTKPEGVVEVKWLGFLQALWVDPFSNLREDTDGNLHLSYIEDKIVKFEFDEDDNETKVKRYSDDDGDGQIDDPQPAGFPQTISLDNINSLWEAGKKLAQTDAIYRNIFTFLDVDDSRDPVGNDDVFDSSDEMILFETANDSRLRPYLNAANDTEASNIISFVRGEDVTGYRNRTVTINQSQEIWKLGDIVYSTPTPVGRPMSNYDLMYGDTSYLEYMQTHINRETIVYVGANDGMLHAFTGGRFKPSDDPYTIAEDHGWFEEVSSSELGTELWAYIPYAVLPHLKWLTSESYTHVFYVDLKPKIADMKIFASDALHTNGWGTVLIGGMRFGGGEITLTDDFGRGSETRTFRSEYFMLDITDPRDPRLIMRFEAPELGFTMSYPSVAKVGDDWFVIFGSGPENNYPPSYDGTSSQKGRLYIVDMKTKISYYHEFNQNNAFLGSPITVDIDFAPSQSPGDTYKTEVGYIGQTYYTANRWKGAMYRFIMKDDVSPSNWLVNEVMINGIDNPVFTPPAIGMDSDRNLWLYFGTGKMLSESDKGSTDREFFIGVKEPCSDFSSTSNCSSTVTISDLNDVTNAVVSSGGSVISNAGSGVNNWNTLFSQVVDDSGYSGWKIELPRGGEKVLAKPTVLGGLVLFTTYIPDTDACSYGGSGYLYSVYYESGTAYKEPTIGLDVDGTTILRSVSLGKGVPASIGMHVGRNDAGKAFVQTSTGTIEEVNTTPPSSVKSGITYWIQ